MFFFLKNNIEIVKILVFDDLRPLCNDKIECFPDELIVGLKEELSINEPTNLMSQCLYPCLSSCHIPHNYLTKKKNILSEFHDEDDKGQIYAKDLVVCSQNTNDHILTAILICVIQLLFWEL